MWSDPEEIEGWGVSPRGAGYIFGQDRVEIFNEKNNTKLYVQAQNSLEYTARFSVKTSIRV